MNLPQVITVILVALTWVVIIRRELRDRRRAKDRSRAEPERGE